MLSTSLQALPWLEMISLVTMGWMFHEVRTQLNAIFQGNSPHKFMQACIHIVKGYLLNNLLSTHLFVHLAQTSLAANFMVGATIILPAGLYISEYMLRKKNRLTPKVKSIFDWLEKQHSLLLTLGFIPLLAFQVGAGLYASAVAASVGALYIMSIERGLLPAQWQNRISVALNLVSIAFQFSRGSYILGSIISITFVSNHTSSIANTLASTTKRFFQGLSALLRYFNPTSRGAQHIDSTLERVYPEPHPSFKYNGKASDLYKNIKNLAVHPQLKVSKTYVHQYKSMLPPPREDIEDDNIMKAFKKIDWIGAQASRLKKEIKADWSSNVSKFNRNSPRACQNALKKGLNTYLKDIRNNALPNTVPGTQLIANRYLDNILFMLEQNLEQEKFEVIIPVLIKLGIEGGQSCPNGKIRVLEEAYRMLSSEGNADLPPRVRIGNILQTDRELFFREKIHDAQNRSFKFSQFLAVIGTPEDTHYDNMLIKIFAPNLGLPQLSLLSEHEKEGLESYFSALSFIEEEFWNKIGVNHILSVCQAAWAGKLTLSSNDYIKWFHDFVENKINDTEEGKEELMEDYEHYPLAQQDVDPDLLTIMLLDMGVLYLNNENVLDDMPPQHASNQARETSSQKQQAQMNSSLENHLATKPKRARIRS